MVDVAGGDERAGAGPAHGMIVGIVDVTGGEGVADPHVLALVRAIARLAETEWPRCSWWW